MSKSSKDSDFICPIFASSQKCEQDALQVMEQFKEFYEEKLSEVDVQGGGDCLEMKLKIQRRWIEDLTEQTQMMARIVKELEDEATSRVRMLEDKLKQTSKNAYEVMKRYQAYSISQNLDEPFQKVFYLENDMKNVLEFVRRVRDDKKWSIDGLQFYDVTYKDLFGKDRGCEGEDNRSPNTNGICTSKQEAPSSDDSGKSEKVDITEPQDQITDLLKKKDEEYEDLKRSMMDMRTALTEEVACKHDMISALRKDIQQLEERCLQSDKQTAFKDDIIKELRKEIKQLKQQEQSSGQNGRAFFEESIQKILARLQGMKRKLKRFYEKRKATEGKLKKLEEDNNSKQMLLGNLYDVIKGLLSKLVVSENKNRDKEESLEKQLEEAKKKIKRMRPCVDVTSTFTDTDEPLVIKKSKLIQNKDDIIQIQNDTLNVIELELQASKKREKELEDEVESTKKEVDALKCKCNDLEKKLTSSQGRADNLQNAVDLYVNSVNVLEAAEEKARIEIEQQKMTIANLQEALVNVKQELDDLRQNSQQEIGYYQYLCSVFYVNVIDLEERNQTPEKELLKLKESYKKLQDCSFELEIEHFSALQDLAILETRLYKYQAEFRNYEKAKAELKKCRQQLRYYEHICACFKQEMTVMAEQLAHLQEILNLSNQSCKEENCQLCCAVQELQNLNGKLQAELLDTEKKVLLENQKNQQKDAKIGELQLIIGQKNADLNIHDDAINEIKQRLDYTMAEKHQLEATVAALNTTVMQLECKMKNEDLERSRKSKSKSAACKRSRSDCRSDSERRRAREADRHEIARLFQKENERLKEKNREKTRKLKHQNEDLKDKLATSEINNKRLQDQVVNLKKEAAQISEKQCEKDHELAQSKQIIIELRQTLIELNESLAENELHQMILVEEYHKQTKEKSQQENIYLSCRCEIALYKKLAENFQSALVDAKKNLCECEARNKSLTDELKTKETKLCDIQKKSAKKEKDTCQCIEELKEKLRDSQAEEQRLSEFVDNMKKHVQKKIEEKKEQVVVRCCKCNNINATQEEINSLKVEIKDMIENQLELNKENDRLLKQVGGLQAAVQALEEENYHLKQKLDKVHNEYQNLREKNKILVREKESYIQTVKNLEYELTEARSNRDDLCIESRCVVNNVKAWLEEQKKINDQVMRRAQGYCDTIKQLKQENETILYAQPLVTSTPCRPTYPKKYERTCADNDCPNKSRYDKSYEHGCTEADCPNQPRYENAYDRGCRDSTCQNKPRYPPNYDNHPCTEEDCENLWALGSQAESPRDSPLSCVCSVEEWYSPNYKDEEETEENDYIDSIEAVTNEMRATNKRWSHNKQRAMSRND